MKKFFVFLCMSIGLLTLGSTTVNAAEIPKVDARSTTVPSRIGTWTVDKTWGEMIVKTWDYPPGRFLYWYLFNFDTKERVEIQRGTSHSLTLAVPKGNYQVQVGDNYGLRKYINVDGSTTSVINGMNVSPEPDGRILLGASSNNPYMSYCIKLLNVNTGKWFTQYNSQWARFRPERGVRYIVQFEIYGWNRRLDYRCYGF